MLQDNMLLILSYFFLKTSHILKECSANLYLLTFM
jgi:hypothetical protein